MDPTNSIRERIEAGEHVLGARARTLSPTLVEVYGLMGLDFVWLDFEHAGRSPWDSPMFEHYTRTADAADVELLVRLPGADPDLIRKVLDTGVRNVIIPRVETPREIRRAMEATRFVYDGGPGERGFATERPAGYGADTEGYIDREDRSVFAGVLIEKREAIEHLDEILDVPELGFVFIGHGDLSVQLGRPMETDHPEVRDTMDTVLEACKDAGVPVGGSVTSAEAAREHLESGYQFVRIGDEIESARQAIGRRLQTLDAEYSR